MAKKKTISKRRVKQQPVSPPDTAQIIADQLASQIRGALDARYRRFCLAMLMAVPIMTPDDMDKVEPTLMSVIGRAALKRKHEALELLEPLKNG